jgi:hypothetical protein
MIEKLKSRKLMVALGGLLTVIATEWVGVSPEIAEKVISSVVVITCAYIGGQGIVDALAAHASGGVTEEPSLAEAAKPAKKAAKKKA